MTEIPEAVVEKAVDALWDELCPGIRQTDEDRAHYRRGVVAALQSSPLMEVVGALREAERAMRILADVAEDVRMEGAPMLRDRADACQAALAQFAPGEEG